MNLIHDAAAQLVLIFVAIMGWLFVSSHRALRRQDTRSPLRSILLGAAPFSLVVAIVAVMLAAWAVS